MSTAGGQSVTHAGLMDKVYASQRHFYDLTRKYYLFGRDQLIRNLAPPPGGSVLEVGCGTARNLVAAAKQWPDARFYGFDISEAMLDTARKSVDRSGLSGKVTLAQGDATNFDPQALFGLEKLDRVFMSYTLSMIPDWQTTIEHGASVLAPGGQLHIVDFGQQEGWPKFWQKFLFAWLGSFHVTPRREMPAVLTRVAEEQGLRLEFRKIMRGYAWGATLTRP
ncbi:MAG: class I SAM-dependent methyltransferase [Pseudomonadota bacterium]